jgi:hypothetical protein
MLKPKQPRRSARTKAEYRWTGAKAKAFLHELAATGSVTKAARIVGMSRQSAYNLRGRLAGSAPAFGQLWDEALAIALSRRCQAIIAGKGAKSARRRRLPGRIAGAS